MEFRALSFCFLLLYVGYCNANSEGNIDFYESYWRSIFLTDTPFPEVLQQFLMSENGPAKLQGVESSKFDGKNILPRPFGPGSADANKNALPQPFGVSADANKNALPQQWGVYAWDTKNSLPQPWGVYGWARKNSLPQPWGVYGWARKNSLPQPWGVYGWARKNSLPQPWGVYGWARKNSLPQPWGVYAWARKNSLPQPYGVYGWGSKNGQSQASQLLKEKPEPTAAKIGDHDRTDLTGYFFEKDLVAGNKIKMEFQKAVTDAKLLPRQVIESVPFSIKKLPEILSLFNINSKSAEAKIVKETLQLCEGPLNPLIEVQFCATSFESLVDYVVSRLGRNNVQAYATEADSEEKKEYTIEENGVEMLGDRSVICHLQNYVHAVFYCHELKSTKAFRVSLSASDGAKAKAVVLCHHDTSGSNPNNLPFRMLNVMPGHEFPICHFLVRGSHAWVTSSVLSDE